MYYPNSQGVTAAVRMLTELKVQFDLVSDFVPWDKYKLLIFPEDVPFTEEYAKRVEAHLKRGGQRPCHLALRPGPRREKIRHRLLAGHV